jgi:hypothetical protein
MSKTYNKKFSIKVPEKAKSLRQSTEFVRIPRKVLKKVSRKIEKKKVAACKSAYVLDTLKKAFRQVRWVNAFNYFFKSSKALDESQLETLSAAAPLESQETTSNEMNEVETFNLELPLQF